MHARRRPRGGRAGSKLLGPANACCSATPRRVTPGPRRSGGRTFAATSPPGPRDRLPDLQVQPLHRPSTEDPNVGEPVVRRRGQRRLHAKRLATSPVGRPRTILRASALAVRGAVHLADQVEAGVEAGRRAGPGCNTPPSVDIATSGSTRTPRSGGREARTASASWPVPSVEHPGRGQRRTHRCRRTAAGRHGPRRPAGPRRGPGVQRRAEVWPRGDRRPGRPHRARSTSYGTVLVELYVAGNGPGCTPHTSKS